MHRRLPPPEFTTQKQTRGGASGAVRSKAEPWNEGIPKTVRLRLTVKRDAFQKILPIGEKWRAIDLQWTIGKCLALGEAIDCDSVKQQCKTRAAWYSLYLV